MLEEAFVSLDDPMTALSICREPCLKIKCGVDLNIDPFSVCRYKNKRDDSTTAPLWHQ